MSESTKGKYEDVKKNPTTLEVEDILIDNKQKDLVQKMSCLNWKENDSKRKEEVESIIQKNSSLTPKTSIQPQKSSAVQVVVDNLINQSL